jgi:hypothetical protein
MNLPTNVLVRGVTFASGTNARSSVKTVPWVVNTPCQLVGGERFRYPTILSMRGDNHNTDQICASRDSDIHARLEGGARSVEV